MLPRNWFFIDSHEFGIFRNYNTGVNCLDKCLSRVEKFNFYFFHNVKDLNNEWAEVAWHKLFNVNDIDSQSKYLKSRVDVTPMLALHRFQGV